jgi:hypothetical protein
VSRAAGALIWLGLLAADALAAQDPSGHAAFPTGEARRVTVAAGPQYARGGLHRMIFGRHYRDLWVAPITVPVLDLGAHAGGLTPKERGGGQQTRSLRLEGADGREYVFRLMEKDPTPGLPRPFRGTLVNRVVRDGISSANPGGALVASAILDATGIPHARPALYVMPAGRRLGRFQDFAGKLGYLEERPEDGFGGSDRVVNSRDLLERLGKDPSNRVDARELLAARLLDQLIGDWDRHRDQWSWAGVSRSGRMVWRPVPRDRDQAFARYDSPLVRFVHPKLVKFDNRYPSIVWLTWNGHDLDRRLLTGLGSRDFDSVAAALQILVTDSVIESAVHRMPEPYTARWGDRLVTALQARRDDLQGQARRYYQLLAEDVDVYATDADETVQAERDSAGALTLRIRASGASVPYYERRFEPRETREVRLFLRGGVDRVNLLGAANAGPKLRIIRTPGRDTIHAAPGFRRFELHDPLAQPPASENEDSAAPDPPPRDWGGSSGLGPTAGFDSDLGLLVGVRASRVDYAFRRAPYGSRVWIGAEYAPGLSRARAGLYADIRRIDPRTRIELRFRASQLEVIRFTGLGNETPSPGDTRYFEVGQWQVTIAPVLEHSPRPGLRLWGGPLVRYTTTDLDRERLVTVERPRGSDEFGRAGLQTGAILTNADSADGHGVALRFSAAGELFPPVLDVTSTYGSLRAEGAARLPLGKSSASPWVAARLEAQRVWGPFPYDDAAYLGGERTLRGYHYQRFAGDAALYGGVELRVPVARVFERMIPTRITLFALGDAGRVWAKGTESSRLHAAAGGGVALSFFEDRHTASLAVASGAEGSRWYLSTGAAF